MILITGGTGFVGAHLLFQLLQSEKIVRAIYREEKTFKVVKRIFSYYTDDVEKVFSKIHWVKADLNDIPLLEEAFVGVTHVYHCAALVSFEPNKFNNLRTINIEGTANVINLSIDNSIKKVCYISSIAAIGTPKKGEKITETVVWNPEEEHSVYGITKYGAELEVWRGAQEGLNVVMVNPGVILGPGIWRYGSGSLFKKIYKGLSYYPMGSVGYVAVNDVVSCMITLMKSDIVNERFILVSENWSYKLVIDTISKALKVKAPKKGVTAKLLSLVWRADWLKHKITGSRRVLSKTMAKTLSENSVYDNTKIKTAIAFKFTPIETVIFKTAQCFIKDNGPLE